MTKKPDIETLLTQIQPEPGERYYQNMQNAPWNKETRTYPVKSLVAAVVAVVIFGASLALTPLGALAQDVISRFFVIQDTNTRTFEVERPIEPTAVADAPVWEPLSLAEAQAQTSFTMTPPQPPAPYEFDGADVYNNGRTVMLSYRIPDDTSVGRNLVFFQSPVSDADPREIGASAVIEQVSINGVPGEYTSGWWAITDENSQGINGDQERLELESEWDNDFGLHYLEWIDGDYAYQIMWQESWNPDFVGQTDLMGYLRVEDLVAMAETVQAD